MENLSANARKILEFFYQGLKSGDESCCKKINGYACVCYSHRKMAKQCNITRQAVTKIINKLVQDGWLVSQKNYIKEKSSWYFLSEKAINVLDLSQAAKDGNQVAKDGNQNGNQAAKDGNQAAKDGNQAAKDGNQNGNQAAKDGNQNGSQAAKDGNQAAKDGNQAAKDGNQAAKDGNQDGNQAAKPSERAKAALAEAKTMIQYNWSPKWQDELAKLTCRALGGTPRLRELTRAEAPAYEQEFYAKFAELEQAEAEYDGEYDG